MKFTGKERDAETGLDSFGARYASAAEGRFTGVDPSFESEILEFPQTWNRYSYVYNRPLVLTDPDGQCPACIGAGIGAVVEGGLDLGHQLFQNGGHLSDVSWKQVGAKAAGGAVEGALAGATLGGTLLLDIAVGATSTAVGGIVDRTLENAFVDSTIDPFSGDAIAMDLVAGAAGGYVGHRAADLIHLPDPGPIPRKGRNYRTRKAAYDARVAARRKAIEGQYYRATAVGTATSAEVGRGINAWSNWMLPSWQSVLNFGFPRGPTMTSGSGTGASGGSGGSGGVTSTICYDLEGYIVCQ